mgnify:CR=1 FL=1
MTRVMVGDALVFENDRLQQRMNQFFDKIEATLRQGLRLSADAAGSATPSVDSQVLASALTAFMAAHQPKMGMHGPGGMHGGPGMMQGPPKAKTTPERLDDMAKHEAAMAAVCAELGPVEFLGEFEHGGIATALDIRQDVCNALFNGSIGVSRPMQARLELGLKIGASR